LCECEGNGGVLVSAMVIRMARVGQHHHQHHTIHPHPMITITHAVTITVTIPIATTMRG
jgi:hypothetical protein